MKGSAIGDRMKEYEEKAEGMATINKHLPWIARLDGHKFSTFASCFRKPFDVVLNEVMVSTTMDLVEEYNFATGYTQSDEITLIHPAIPNTEEFKNTGIMFRGRMIKLCTLLSGYCSARFNYHCRRLVGKIPKEYSKFEKVSNRMLGGQAHFDCRIFNVSSNAEMLNNLIWRQSDIIRNSKTNLGRKFFSQKRMNGVKANEVVQLLKKEKNVNWEDYPVEFRFGAFVKKELYLKQAINPRTNEKVEVNRSRVIPRSFYIQKFDEKNIDLFLRKYW